MARFLFITWHGGGNVPPAIGIAQKLKERGHTISFAGYKSQQRHIIDQGFSFAPIDPLSGNWMDLSPEQRILGEIEIWACQDHLRQVPRLVVSEGADAMLVDCMLHGALAAVENLSLPYAILVHTTLHSFEPGGRFDRLMLSSVNAVRAQAGRSTVSNSWEAWSSAPVICATLPELDPLASKVPPSFHYVGPVFEHVPPSGWHSPWLADDPRPLILVSFSTHNQDDQTSRLDRTLKALTGDRYRVLATSGMVDIKGIKIPENAFVTPYLPHEEVLPEAKVLVTHAGHGTVTASLAHAVPMVCLPNTKSDQPGIAAQLEALGAGLVLDGEHATVEEIAKAVERVVGDQSYSAAARRLADAIKAARAAEQAASLLEGLL